MFDLVLLLALPSAAAVGFRRGLAHSVVDLLSVVVAYGLAVILYDLVAVPLVATTWPVAAGAGRWLLLAGGTLVAAWALCKVLSLAWFQQPLHYWQQRLDPIVDGWGGVALGAGVGLCSGVLVVGYAALGAAYGYGDWGAPGTAGRVGLAAMAPFERTLVARGFERPADRAARWRGGAVALVAACDDANHLGPARLSGRIPDDGAHHAAQQLLWDDEFLDDCRRLGARLRAQPGIVAEGPPAAAAAWAPRERAAVARIAALPDVPSAAATDVAAATDARLLELAARGELIALFNEPSYQRYLEWLFERRIRRDWIPARFGPGRGESTTAADDMPRRRLRQPYRWVDADGVMHFSDAPPAAAAGRPPAVD